MRSIFIIISHLILLSLLIILTLPVFTGIIHEDKNGIILTEWEADTGSGFLKCGPVLWNLPENKGGTGAVNYTGYGTYRTTAVIPSSFKGKPLALFFNGIDDADETFFNGRKTGSAGAFPSSPATAEGYVSAWACPRVYYIPESIINFNSENLIEVRVYNHSGKGGIYGYYKPEINDCRLLEKKAFSLSLLRNGPRIFVLSIFAFFIALLTYRVTGYVQEGFIPFFIHTVSIEINPFMFHRMPGRQSRVKYTLLHDLAYKYIWMLVTLAAAFVFILYEITMRDVKLIGMETLGVKYHIPVLYTALFSLILLVHRDIFYVPETYSTPVHRILHTAVGIITHPFIFLCYMLYAFTRSSNLLYNDFPSRGSYIVITILSIMICIMVSRIFTYNSGSRKRGMGDYVYRTALNVLFMMACIASVTMFIIAPPLLSNHTTTIVSLLFILYITITLSSDQKKIVLFRSNTGDRRNGRKNTAQNDKIEVIKKFIETNCDSEIKRDDIAAAMNMSPEHLSRIFNNCTGKTIVDYINEARITRSAGMLRDTDKTVIEIGFASGFSSLRTFNRSFLKYMGTSPTMYRQKHRESTGV